MKISVKLKVTLWYTLVMIITSVIVLTAMISISRDMIERDVKARVVRTVEENSRHIMMPFPPMRHESAQRRFPFYEQGVHMIVYGTDGNIINGQMPFDLGENTGFMTELTEKICDGNKYYIYDKEIRTPRSEEIYWLRGVISVTDESYAVETVTKNNIILTAILILFASAGGYLIISRAFVPVNKISRTAQEISESTDLSRRINIGRGKDEISSLANTFDTMLDKIERTFEREKQFTSDASHELRTPVAVILSECEYMEECAKDETDYKESANSIRRQADKMSKLISELLMISRMDKNTVKLNFEETDVSELLTFVCDEQEEIRDTHIELIRNIKENVIANIDRDHFARVFINLISNAYQYSGNGRKITVSLNETEKDVVFSVADEGIGIAAENVPKIWERFYQAEQSRTTKNEVGMGLGLSMVKWIVKAHKGFVSVQSELGKGSAFKVRIPKQ